MLLRTHSVVRLAAAVSLAAAPTPGVAQTVLHVPGKVVEVIGLHRWTLGMIQDSLDVHAPGESLTSHACAAILRNKLHFADASSLDYLGLPGDSVEYNVVSVVEPEDSARVHYKPAPLDSTHPHPGWEQAIALVQHDPGAVEAAIQGYAAWRAGDSAKAVPEWARSHAAAIVEYLHFIAAHAGDTDATEATALLDSSPDYRNRTVAVSILVNFLDRDATLYTLVDALRESDGPVRNMAAQVLMRVVESPRSVDWRPVAPTIHAILDGTSLFELPAMMQLLVATHVQPDLATPLLGGGGQMVLAYAAAQHRPERLIAHQLLVALAGRDLGTDAARWRAWIAAL